MKPASVSDMKSDVIKLRVLEQYCRLKDYPSYAVSNYGKVLNISGQNQIAHNTNGAYASVILCHNGQSKGLSVHRLVGTCFIDNPLGLPEIDHFDRNTYNNHVYNLRWSTTSQNSLNRAIPSHRNGRATTSIYRGVSKHKHKRRWYATISHNRKTKHIGSFPTEIEAAIGFNEYVRANNLPNELNVIPESSE
ncbi:MAG: hypothetical protein P4M14_12505 [Gammaproteobacteria bacterium]|nr:hypothetical protein [Gammaproteobacteria bacterium]